MGTGHQKSGAPLPGEEDGSPEPNLCSLVSSFSYKHPQYARHWQWGWEERTIAQTKHSCTVNPRPGPAPGSFLCIISFRGHSHFTDEESEAEKVRQPMQSNAGISTQIHTSLGSRKTNVNVHLLSLSCEHLQGEAQAAPSHQEFT